MTGRFSPSEAAEVQMLRYRQSSLDSAAAPEPWAQGSAKAEACLTPLQGMTGCGACQRRLPTGGAANGIPLKAATPLSTLPRTVPPVTSACSIVAVAGQTRQTHKVASHFVFIGDLKPTRFPSKSI